jgi:hypothetical protein
MARMRAIKPGFFVNPELSEVDPLGRILFIGLWTAADREGRLEDRPKRLKAELLPYDECDVNALLTQLAEKGFIQRYTSDKSYIQIHNFTKHQSPHPKEPQSEIPAPGEDLTPEDKSIKFQEWVYFIRCEETKKIKIGKAEDPSWRLRQLQTGNASKLVLLGAIAGSLEVEKQIHEKFAHLRFQGEWFTPDSQLIEWIDDTLKSGNGSEEPRRAAINHGGQVSSKALTLTRTLTLTQEEKPSTLSRVDSFTEQVTEVFNHWKSVMNHPRSVLDAKRRRIITSRLKDGLTIEQLKTAVDGCRASPFHMGKNDDSRVHDGIDLIFRNAEKVEWFENIKLRNGANHNANSNGNDGTNGNNSQSNSGDCGFTASRTI